MELKFIEIQKAQLVLTDEEAMSSFEKFGTADGYQGTTIGMALPEFLMQKENAGYIMLVYCVLLLIVLPVIVIMWWRSTTSFANEILIKTLQYFGYLCSESQMLPRKHILEILCVAEEFKTIPMRNSDEKPLNMLMKQYDISTRPLLRKLFDEKRLSIITKVLVLFTIHLNGSRNDLKQYPELDSDLDKILEIMPKLLEAMPDIAFQIMYSPSRQQFSENEKKRKQQLEEDQLRQKEKGIALLDELLSIMQCTFQGLSEDEDPIMQLPHMTDSVMKEIRKKFGKKSSTSKNSNYLPNSLHQSINEKKSILKEILTSDQLSNVEGVLNIIPNLEIDFNYCVLDEVLVTPKSLITFNLLIRDPNILTLSQLQPAHTPRFSAFRYDFY
jgi:translocation protein SEC63